MNSEAKGKYHNSSKNGMGMPQRSWKILYKSHDLIVGRHRRRAPARAGPCQQVLRAAEDKDAGPGLLDQRVAALQALQGQPLLFELGPDAELPFAAEKENVAHGQAAVYMTPF